jgi:hypothetical protein
MKKGTAHPYKDDRKVSEVGREDLSACFFEITNVGIEVVSVSVEVPNPSCGFGTFGKRSREKSRCA